LAPAGTNHVTEFLLFKDRNYAVSVFAYERPGLWGQFFENKNPAPGTGSSPDGGKLPTPPFHYAASAVGTALLLAFCTWALIHLRTLTDDQRPYTILYLIPVALGAALMGVRGGLISSLAALILARVFLFSDQKHGLDLFRTLPQTSEAVEFASLLLSTVTVSIVTGRLRSALGQVRSSQQHIAHANLELEGANLRLEEINSRLEHTNVRLRESEEQRRVFHRDVLMAVTGGKLRLVEREAMPPSDLASGAPMLTLPLEEPADASRLRRTLQKIAEDIGMDADRTFDLCTGTTEAATNAIKHGNGGKARVWVDSKAVVVEVADRGTGIAPAQIARATLQQGYSTKVSLGMGFHLMMQASDVMALSTSPHGTSILLSISFGPRPSAEETLLARYVGL
jgi:anti-sigma regulatory factor (Ser/Thr protein kinase)